MLAPMYSCISITVIQSSRPRLPSGAERFVECAMVASNLPRDALARSRVRFRLRDVEQAHQPEDLRGSGECRDAHAIQHRGRPPLLYRDHQHRGHFQLAGFDPTPLFEMEGRFTELACSAGCEAAPVSSERSVHEMAAHEEGCRVPNEYHTKCERCGAPMRVNMADGNSFFKTAEWAGKHAAFKDFLAAHVNDRSVILELGVGMRNPLVTGALAEAKQTLRDASAIVINKGGGAGLRPDGALCIDVDITRALQGIEQEMKRCR